jgi:oxalate decarboxylase/phosphoglucose isomerase-like protein (cupin superfamily)
MSQTGPVDPNAIPTQTFDWGAIKWFVTPSATEGARVTFGEVVLLPGQGHERHNHPQSEEVLYVLSGEGRQMLEEDGEERWFDIQAGQCIYVRTGQFHATMNEGWQTLRLLALYNPGGADRDLEGLPDFQQLQAGTVPAWTRG